LPTVASAFNSLAFDIALRDFGLALGAIALARLAVEFDTSS